MTWNPLRRNYLTTRPTTVPEVFTTASERELQVIFQKLQLLEETSKRLQKDMKKYLESITNTSKAEQKLTTDLSSSSLCHHNAELRKLVEDYHSVVSQVSDSIQDLSVICQKTFQEPAKKYGSYFADVASALHHREQLVQEWQRAAARVRRLDDRERTAANVAKRARERRALEAVAAELVACHNALISELNTFIDHSADYFNPTLQALIRAKLDYYGNMTRLFTLLFPAPPGVQGSPSSAMIPEDQYQKSIQDKLAKIRNLSIVKQDN